MRRGHLIRRLPTSTTRLAEVSGAVPSLDALTVSLLDRLDNAYQAMLAGGLESAIQALNMLWSSCPVEITSTAGKSLAENFSDSTKGANLRIVTAQGHERRVLHHHVARLKELR